MKKFVKSTLGQWVVFFGVVAIIVTAFYSIFTYIPYFSQRTYFVIITGSMSPIIDIGDIAIIDKNYNPDDLQVGDIVAFYANLDMKGENEVVVHYVADIQKDEQGKVTLHTMRANDNPQKVWDSWEITQQDIIGKMDFKILHVGKFLLFAESSFGKMILIADIIIFYLIFDLWKEEDKKQPIKDCKKMLIYNEKKIKKLDFESVVTPAVIEVLFANNNEELMHSKRVVYICELIAKQMDMSLDEIERLKIAALLHDIGKIGVNKKILNKPTRLTQKEKRAVKKHTTYGYNILKNVKSLNEIAKIILQHHEQWDGKGYPKSIAGGYISLQARIIAVADAYDAMISVRSYKPAGDKQEALQELVRCSGTQFDPQVVDVFVNDVFEKYLKEQS